MATLLFQKVFSGAVDNTSVGVFERGKKKYKSIIGDSKKGTERLEFSRQIFKDEKI